MLNVMEEAMINEAYELIADVKEHADLKVFQEHILKMNEILYAMKKMEEVNDTLEKIMRD